MLDPSIEPRRPQMGLSPKFAASQVANVLLAMGVVLFLIGCGAPVIGHTTIAAPLIAVGLSTSSSRLGGSMLTFEVVKVKTTAKFVDRG